MHFARHSQHRYGFTLVELSIVLVILGLLIGGVLTGQTLIRAAELRSVTTQEQRYVTAVQTFRDKYFGLPGDMTNATSYWGAADGSTGTTTGCLTATGTGTQTCNGDGDGKTTVDSFSNERYRFWQHLANAGLIEGSYTGVANATTFGATSGNVPPGRISGSYWWASSFSALVGSTSRFDGQYDNYFEIGAIIGTGEPAGPLFKPEEAYNIDTKTDDGKPGTGKIVTVSSFATTPGCTDTTLSSNLSANYLLTNTAQACGLLWRLAY